MRLRYQLALLAVIGSVSLLVACGGGSADDPLDEDIPGDDTVVDGSDEGNGGVDGDRVDDAGDQPPEDAGEGPRWVSRYAGGTTGSAMLVDGRREWVTYLGWEDGGKDFYEIGAAEARFFRQRPVVDFGVEWMRRYRSAQT